MNKLAKEVTQKTEIEQGEQYPWAAERSTPYRTSYCTRITDIPDLTANCEKTNVMKVMYSIILQRHMTQYGGQEHGGS